MYETSANLDILIFDKFKNLKIFILFLRKQGWSGPSANTNSSLLTTKLKVFISLHKFLYVLAFFFRNHYTIFFKY